MSERVAARTFYIYGISSHAGSFFVPDMVRLMGGGKNQKFLLLYVHVKLEDMEQINSIQFNSIQFYLYSAKLQQLSSQGT